MNSDLDPEVLMILLEKKLDFLGTIADVSMLWWVSATLLGTAIIAAIWSSKDDVRNEHTFVFHGLFFLILLFFGSIVVYGWWTLRTLDVLKSEIDQILVELEIPTIFLSEYSGVKGAITIGTTSFLILFFSWLILWIVISYKDRKTHKAFRKSWRKLFKDLKTD